MSEKLPELLRNTSQKPKEKDWGTSGREIVEKQENGVSKCKNLHFWKCSDVQDRGQN